MKAEYIDHMGSDLTVVNAARVSFDKESQWKEVYVGWNSPECRLDKVLSTPDNKLIAYLAKHNHWTPFSHCQITLRETVPIFVARQRFKHTVGFTYNEISRRYVDSPPDLYEPTEWRGRAFNKKQGSSDEVIDLENFDASKTIPSRLNAIALETYNELLRIGVAPEQARMVLPQSMYTSYYTTGSLAAFARAYRLRVDSHAQQEIQELAYMWDTIIRPLYPVSWAALVDG